ARFDLFRKVVEIVKELPFLVDSKPQMKLHGHGADTSCDFITLTPHLEFFRRHIVRFRREQRLAFLGISLARAHEVEELKYEVYSREAMLSIYDPQNICLGEKDLETGRFAQGR